MRMSSKRLQKSKTFSKLPENVLSTKTVKKRLQNQNLWFTGMGPLNPTECHTSDFKTKYITDEHKTSPLIIINL